MSKRVLSGIRATGRLHLGNYLGAVKGMLELQSRPDYETFYMVVDLHTITTPYDKSTLKESVRNIIIDYLSAGLDPEKSAIFVQSLVPEHIELAYYFSTVITVAKMQHLPTFKEKVKQYPENVTMALLNYPVLMAADILIYKASLIPVGIDQEPHLEVAREIARRFNQDYGTDFPEPVSFKTKGDYVPSLTGEGKMSKSVEGSFINLTDDFETIRGKIARIPTDSGRGFIKNGLYISHSAIPKGVGNIAPSGGVKTLMEFVELFEGKARREEFEKEYSSNVGLRYKELKNELSEIIFNQLAPIQEKRRQLEKDSAYVDRVILAGAEKARVVARQTLKEVKGKMGLG